MCLLTAWSIRWLPGKYQISRGQASTNRTPFWFITFISGHICCHTFSSSPSYIKVLTLHLIYCVLALSIYNSITGRNLSRLLLCVTTDSLLNLSLSSCGKSNSLIYWVLYWENDRYIGAEMSYSSPWFSSDASNVISSPHVVLFDENFNAWRSRFEINLRK